MKLVELKPDDDYTTSALKVLRDVAERVKRGELDCVAIAGFSPRDGAFNTWSKASNHPALVGAVAHLQHRMLSEATTTTHDMPA